MTLTGNPKLKSLERIVLFSYDPGMSPELWSHYALPISVQIAPGLHSLDNLEIPFILNLVLFRLGEAL
jgi:hypothetical protein